MLRVAIVGCGKIADSHAAEIQRIAEGYGAWQGYWAHYVRVAGLTRRQDDR